MSHFSLDPAQVRVDIFKPSGKWYTTIALNFDTYSHKDESIQTTFRRCMKEQHPFEEGFLAICLEPCHEHSHPLMTTF